MMDMTGPNRPRIAGTDARSSIPDITRAHEGTTAIHPSIMGIISNPAIQGHP